MLLHCKVDTYAIFTCTNNKVAYEDLPFNPFTISEQGKKIEGFEQYLLAELAITTF